MCFLLWCNLALVKNLKLKLKKLCCCCSNTDDNNDILVNIYKLEQEIDAKMHELHDDIHNLKNNLYRYRKKNTRTYWANYDS